MKNTEKKPSLNHMVTLSGLIISGVTFSTIANYLQNSLNTNSIQIVEKVDNIKQNDEVVQEEAIDPIFVNKSIDGSNDKTINTIYANQANIPFIKKYILKHKECVVKHIHFKYCIFN